MTLEHKRIVLTGATGGIGAALADRLAAAGSRLLLVGRDDAKLAALGQRMPGSLTATADLTVAGDVENVAATVREHLGGVDILINNAGRSRFCLFEHEQPELAEAVLAANLLGPIRLTRALLPDLQRAGIGQIVNIGSTFGSLAFPGFSSYAASKFGLRGWSEALRRELAADGISVSYLAPRATRTAANDARVNALNAELRTAVDDPERVARALVAAIEQRRPRLQLGTPERLFSLLNALLPGAVDRALRG